MATISETYTEIHVDIMKVLFSPSQICTIGHAGVTHFLLGFLHSEILKQILLSVTGVASPLKVIE